MMLLKDRLQKSSHSVPMHFQLSIVSEKLCAGWLWQSLCRVDRKRRPTNWRISLCYEERSVASSYSDEELDALPYFFERFPYLIGMQYFACQTGHDVCITLKTTTNKQLAYYTISEQILFATKRIIYSIQLVINPRRCDVLI